MQNINENRKIEQKKTKQVVIDAGLHRLLKSKAATENTSLRTLVEGSLVELLEVKNET